MPSRLRLADLLGGLSITADLGYGLPPEEAMRSCLIATALAREHGLPEAEVSDCFYAALLRHLGCTGIAHDASEAWGDERLVNAVAARTNPADPQDVAATGLADLLVPRPGTSTEGLQSGSCEVASATARRIGLGDGVQRALNEVGEWWNGGGSPAGLRGEEISPAARIAVAAADAARFDRLGGVEAAVEALKQRAGGTRDPDVVATFVRTGPAILARIHAGDPRELLVETEPEPVVEIDAERVVDVAAAFGDLADLKSPWMHGHSAGVARLARGAAERLGLDGQTTARLEISALLEDLGRLAVSNAIWEKPGPLTAAQWEEVRTHPYRTERILATSAALEPMARVAGMHHERLDGKGYHRGCAARELPPAARVLTAADAFHAMTQARPHRPALTAEAAAEELKREVRAGRFDSDAACAVLEAAGSRPPRRRDNVRPAGLTEREVEVACLVAAGLSNPEIATRLVISRRTAEHHVQNIYGKVGVATRAGLALFVHEHHLVAAGA